MSSTAAGRRLRRFGYGVFYTLPGALRRALAASALAVTVRGASPSLPTAAAVDAFLLEHP